MAKKKKLQRYDIWEEGFLISGMEGTPQKAHLLADNIEASSFRQACVKQCKDDPNFDKKKLSIWGCRLFRTKKEARKLFG